MKKPKTVVRRNSSIARLQPEAIHRVIQDRGLEECGEVLMQATPHQIKRIFDLDLWRPAQAGNDDQFDAERFGQWLEVLAEVDVDQAAQKITEMDADIVIAGLAQHVRVFDLGVTAPEGNIEYELGGYRLFPKRAGSWEAIQAILLSLDMNHSDFFHQVMRGCRGLSNAGFELDGLDDLLSKEEQGVFDLAIDREQRRDEQGYVAPAQARGFLETSRRIPLASKALPVADAVPHFRALMEFVFEHDRTASEKRSEELTYIANTLMSGCAIQGRAFTTQEASDAAVAVCDLGLENWERHDGNVSSLPSDFLVDQALVAVFQLGWTVLHNEVGMYTATRLQDVLAGIRCVDEHIQTELDVLRLELHKCCRAGMPWRARNALDAIAILDMPAWAALGGLIDECPVLHAAISALRHPQTRSVGASDFEFISSNSQITVIHRFIRSLPEILRP